MNKIKLLLTAILLSSVTGCFSLLPTSHAKYCTEFTEMERTAFRMLAGNTVQIDCTMYKD